MIWLKTGWRIDIVINTSDNKSSRDDAKKIRQSVLANNIAYFTTIAAAKAAALAIKSLKANRDGIEPNAIQDYLLAP